MHSITPTGQHLVREEMQLLPTHDISLSFSLAQSVPGSRPSPSWPWLGRRGSGRRPGVWRERLHLVPSLGLAPGRQGAPRALLITTASLYTALVASDRASNVPPSCTNSQGWLHFGQTARGSNRP